MNKNVYLITPRMCYVTTRRDKNNNLYLFICELEWSECVCGATEPIARNRTRIETCGMHTHIISSSRVSRHTSAIAIRLPPHLTFRNQGTREYFDSHNIRVDLNASSTFSNLTTTTTTTDAGDGEQHQINWNGGKYTRRDIKPNEWKSLRAHPASTGISKISW